MSDRPTPTLFAFSGLPGSGKSTLAKRLAAHEHAAYVRIDTIEQALRDLCGVSVQGEGYALGYALARDNLHAGVSVVADSCNPIPLTRDAWAEVAHAAGARHVNIEVICSDAAEHRRRVEGRASSIARLVLPSWKQVCERDYASWVGPCIVVDTASRSAADSFAVLARALDASVA